MINLAQLQHQCHDNRPVIATCCLGDRLHSAPALGNINKMKYFIFPRCQLCYLL